MTIANLPAIRACRPAWNKGRVVGQKRPLMTKHVWAIRVHLEIAMNHRDLALSNLAIDSMLRGTGWIAGIGSGFRRGKSVIGQALRQALAPFPEFV